MRATGIGAVPVALTTAGMPSAEGPAFHADFHEPAGDTVHDCTGRGHDGQLHDVKICHRALSGDAIRCDHRRSPGEDGHGATQCDKIRLSVCLDRGPISSKFDYASPSE